MREIFAKFVTLALFVGVVEAGFDVGSMTASGDSQLGAHEMHDHLGPDSDPSDGNDADADHYCHCVAHGAALTLSVATPEISREVSSVTFEPSVYHSLAIPPPVRPPNA